MSLSFQIDVRQFRAELQTRRLFHGSGVIRFFMSIFRRTTYGSWCEQRGISFSALLQYNWSDFARVTHFDPFLLAWFLLNSSCGCLFFFKAEYENEYCTLEGYEIVHCNTNEYPIYKITNRRNVNFWLYVATNYYDKRANYAKDGDLFWRFMTSCNMGLRNWYLGS